MLEVRLEMAVRELDGFCMIVCPAGYSDFSREGRDGAMGKAADQDATENRHYGYKVGTLGGVLDLNLAYGHGVRARVDGKEEGALPVVIAENKDSVARDAATAVAARV